MNDLVVKQFGSVEKAQKLASKFRRIADRGPAESGGFPILKLDKEDGTYSFGEDNTPVEDDDVWVVHSLGIQHGYIAFKLGDNGIAEYEDESGNVRKAEFIVDFEEDETEIELPELEEERYKKEGKYVKEVPPFKYQFVIRMKCVEGPNEGAVVIYKPTAPSAISAMRKMIKEIGKRIDRLEPYMPAVSLESKTFYSKSFSKDVWYPDWEYLGWEAFDDQSEFDAPETEGDDDDGTDQEVKKNTKANNKATRKSTTQKRKKPDPEPEPEEDDEEDFDGETIDADYEEIEPEEEEVEEEKPKTRKPAGRKKAPNKKITEKDTAPKRSYRKR